MLHFFKMSIKAALRTGLAGLFCDSLFREIVDENYVVSEEI